VVITLEIIQSGNPILSPHNNDIGLEPFANYVKFPAIHGAHHDRDVVRLMRSRIGDASVFHQSSQAQSSRSSIVEVQVQGDVYSKTVLKQKQRDDNDGSSVTDSVQSALSSELPDEHEMFPLSNHIYYFRRFPEEYLRETIALALDALAKFMCTSVPLQKRCIAALTHSRNHRLRMNVLTGLIYLCGRVHGLGR